MLILYSIKCVQIVIFCVALATRSQYEFPARIARRTPFALSSGGKRRWKRKGLLLCLEGSRRYGPPEKDIGSFPTLGGGGSAGGLGGTLLGGELLRELASTVASRL